MDSTRRNLLTTGAAAAAVAAAPSAFAQAAVKGETAGRFYQKGNVRIRYQDVGSGVPLLIIHGGGQPALTKQRPDITMEMVDRFLTQMYGGARADFVRSVSRDVVRSCQIPVLVMPDDSPPHPYVIAMESAMLAPKSEVSMYPWKDTKDKIPLAVRQVRTFLRAHRPATA